ncbi:MAG: helix-turn-helix domain-containing protein [Candidatus Firestonebacteria bacterium]
MPPDDLKDFATLEDLEKRMIEYTLTKCESNQIETAKKLGISRTSLWRKIRKYGIVS